ncbi:MAG: decaprenyl-phosphate phosphoribosyltransferase [Candidatus Symbiobacter sp.]|nr:decaprenyl-phosphate phosphoribosyltransferase [Candidatus Symbiobacter sp.]
MINTPYLKLLRPHQWVKNGFVLAPLFFTPDAVTVTHITKALLGVLVFCLLASAVYILNDYADRASDRLHPTKKNRPLAAGTVTTWAALALCLALLVVALGICLQLPSEFAIIAIIYFVANLLYSLGLKKISLVDVSIVAAFYALRVMAGAALINVSASVWILSATFLLALFIALAKRRDDVVQELDTAHRTALRGYSKNFLDHAITMCLGSLVVCYLIYTTEAEVTARLHGDKLYLTTPLVILGVLRYLQITLVEQKSGEPTAILLRDRFLFLCVAGWVVVYGLLIYGIML